MGLKNKPVHNWTKSGEDYFQDYRFVLRELRAGTYHIYGLIVPPKGNMDALRQAEKDYDYECRQSNNS